MASTPDKNPKQDKNTKNKRNLNIFRAFGIVALAGIITVSSVFLAQRYWQDGTKREAKAGNSVTLYPGQTGNFNITYTNGGDSDLLENALLNVLIGSELVVDVSTITDTFNGGQTFPVIPAAITKIDAVTGTTIKYRPGTANTAGTPSGLNTAGNITLPPEKNGVLTFKATLKADTLSSGRTQIATPYNYVIDKQGIYSILQFTGNGSVPGAVDLVVANAPVGSSSSRSSVSSISSSVSSSLVSSSISSAISSSAISSSLVSSSAISSSVSSSVPATSFGCTGGINAPNDCRIYFISTNGAALNWDGTTKFNTNYSDLQKWREGTVRLVFDNIKRNDNSMIPDGSACSFNIYRYTQTQVLRTLPSTTSAGRCQVDFPTNLQGTNYYTIIASANDKNDNQSMKAMDRLVLYVGGIGTRLAPIVEI